jgi:hypothetical protein
MKKEDQYQSGATIQIDVRELQLQDAPEGEAAPKSRATPPPLPPSAFVSAPPAAPPEPNAAPAAPKPSSTKPVVYGAVFVALLAAAIFGGVKVGTALRAAPAPQASAPTASAPAPSASAPAVISIPTIEFTGPPSDTK